MPDEARRVDRLSALMERFALRLGPAAPGAGNLHLVGRGSGAERMVLRAAPGAPVLAPGEAVLFSAGLDWGGPDNPLAAALPREVAQPLGPEDAALAALFIGEAGARRCGAAQVLNRLAEVMVIRLLRAAIAAGAASPGLLAGLADPRLARAIVAMHEAPARAWSNRDLALEAGLSLSRFAELFHAATGETPMGYLRRWRLVLARRELARGARVQSVARRCGYGSPEALARAYRRQFGEAPLAVRGSAR